MQLNTDISRIWQKFTEYTTIPFLKKTFHEVLMRNICFVWYAATRSMYAFNKENGVHREIVGQKNNFLFGSTVPICQWPYIVDAVSWKSRQGKVSLHEIYVTCSKFNLIRFSNCLRILYYRPLINLSHTQRHTFVDRCTYFQPYYTELLAEIQLLYVLQWKPIPLQCPVPRCSDGLRSHCTFRHNWSRHGVWLWKEEGCNCARWPTTTHGLSSDNLGTTGLQTVGFGTCIFHCRHTFYIGSSENNSFFDLMDVFLAKGLAVGVSEQQSRTCVCVCVCVVTHGSIQRLVTFVSDSNGIPVAWNVRHDTLVRLFYDAKTTFVPITTNRRNTLRNIPLLRSVHVGGKSWRPQSVCDSYARRTSYIVHVCDPSHLQCLVLFAWTVCSWRHSGVHDFAVRQHCSHRLRHKLLGKPEGSRLLESYEAVDRQLLYCYFFGDVSFVHQKEIGWRKAIAQKWLRGFACWRWLVHLRRWCSHVVFLNADPHFFWGMLTWSLPNDNTWSCLLAWMFCFAIRRLGDIIFLFRSSISFCGTNLSWQSFYAVHFSSSCPSQGLSRCFCLVPRVVRVLRTLWFVVFQMSTFLQWLEIATCENWGLGSHPTRIDLAMLTEPPRIFQHVVNILSCVFAKFISSMTQTRNIVQCEHSLVLILSETRTCPGCLACTQSNHSAECLQHALRRRALSSFQTNHVWWNENDLSK